MAKWKIIVRKAGSSTNFIDIGEVDQFHSLGIHLRYNEISRWELAVDANSLAASYFYEIARDPNNKGRGGIRVYRDGDLIISGPMLHMSERVNSREKMLTIQGADELWYVYARAHLMNPRYFTTAMTSRDHVPNKATTSDAEYYAGAIVHEAIDSHVINTPDTERNLFYGKSIRSNIGFNFKYENGVPGGTVEYKWMIGSGENLWENMKGILDYSDYNGFPIRVYGQQEGDWVVFRTETPPYKPNARLSYKLGTITEYEYIREAPTCNMIQVAATVKTSASDSTPKRIFNHAGDEVSKSHYGWIERFEEHGGARSLEGSTTTSEAYKELLKYAKAKLREYGEKISFSFKFQESPSVKYGHKADGDGVSYFRIGCKVPVELINTSTEDIVRSVIFRVSGNEETIEPTVGSEGVIAKGFRHFDQLNKLWARYTGLSVRDNAF